MKLHGLHMRAWCQVTHVTSSRLIVPAARKKQVARRTNISRPEPKTNGHGLGVTHIEQRESCCTHLRPMDVMHPCLGSQRPTMLAAYAVPLAMLLHRHKQLHSSRCHEGLVPAAAAAEKKSVGRCPLPLRADPK